MTTGQGTPFQKEPHPSTLPEQDGAAESSSAAHGDTGGTQPTPVPAAPLPRVTTPLPRCGTAPKGGMPMREDSPEPGTSAGSTSRVPRDANREHPVCPVCRDMVTACSEACRHCFCSLCVWDWNLGDPLCPQCQRPARHRFPQHVALYHEVQDQVYDTKRRRARRCSGYAGQDGYPGRGRRRRHRGGRWWSRGRNSPRRRQRRSRDWDGAPDEGRAPRSEGDMPDSRQGRRSRRARSQEQQEEDQEQSRGRPSRQRWWSRDREHSHGWDRHRWRSRGRSQRTRSQGTEPHERSARQRHWRGRNAEEGRAPRHLRDIPDSAGRSRDRRRTRSPAGHRTP